MTFQIHALDPEAYAPLFDLDDAELAARNARRVVVDACPGYPCRVSLQDAPVGTEVILTNHTHQPAASAFQAAHAIYVQPGAVQATPAVGEVPAMMKLRLASVRGFNARDEICKADVAQGEALADTITTFLADADVAYVHIHNARLGCFTARADRA